MSFVSKIRELLIGAPRNPLSPDTHRSIALVAFLAWIGLGADGLSSACYGPEESFLALGTHTSLALYITIATVATVFIISLAYNQVVELFPSGGGGYKVATQLLGKHAGLVSGAALIVDYVLTIAISTASGMDALFSLLPTNLLEYKLAAEFGVVIVLIVLNLRGMKESITVLLPIFIGFVIMHVGLIMYGVISHEHGLPVVINQTIKESQQLTSSLGLFFVLALTLRAYSLGSGTYTGIEAVSNNVNRLAEPRVRTGKWTMFYMAVSLSFTAGGIILLYLLWDAQHIDGQTLNAVVFHKILGDTPTGNFFLIVTLVLEAGLLFVGANTGFLAGPSVLANMAVDQWVPNRFRHLSSRLVTQNGIIVFGIAALIILLISEGHVAWLVVLYSMNVFLTFSMSILGLCVYWYRHRQTASMNWRWRLCFSAFALCITSSILMITLLSKFSYGGWVTVVITSIVIVMCLLVKQHYTVVTKKLHRIDTLLTQTPIKTNIAPVPLRPQEPTAVIFVSKHRGVGMHSLLWIQRMFPDHFKNFIFISAGVVDVESFAGQHDLAAMQKEVNSDLSYFVGYCEQHGLAAKTIATFGIDPAKELTEAAAKIIQEFPNSIFFASKLIFEHENWLTRLLHHETAITLQKRLHTIGAQLVIMPMKVD